jgi:hypothetical protein
MPAAGFEPTIPIKQTANTYALDHAATGTGLPMRIFEKASDQVLISLYSISHNNVLNYSNNNKFKPHFC